MTHRILIVEDDPDLAEALCDTLSLAGYEVASATDGRAALAAFEEAPADLVLTDVQMQPMDGQTLLRQLRARHGTVPVLVMTAFGTVEQAVEAMKLGAADYLAKPFEGKALLDKVARYLPGTGAGDCCAEPVAEDPRTREVIELARRVARSEATVLIGGESGTGKEVLARFLHGQSNRADGPFVAINCAAIPENMLEAVLFGYEKGAYTGAVRASAGKFEQAQGGTLLLDEISEMSLALQAKLLRVLQEREVERLGGREPIQLDVRVLATTNRRLREEVSAGRFREDLFYRLNVFPLILPPLRDRSRDIVPLARWLLTRHLEPGRAVPRLDARAEAALLAHDWPGNVRELDNLMQRALILADGGDLGAEHLHFETLEPSAAAGMAPDSQRGGLSDDLRSVEEQRIVDALRDGNGSRKHAAEVLGISPRTLRYKIARMREAGVALP
jgi:two-component system response regulator FlrC